MEHVAESPSRTVETGTTSDAPTEQPVHTVTAMQDVIRTQPVIKEVIDPRTMSGDYYDLPHTD